MKPGDIVVLGVEDLGWQKSSVGGRGLRVVEVERRG